MDDCDMANQFSGRHRSRKQKIERRTVALYADLFSRITDEEFSRKAQNYANRIKIGKDWFLGKVCLDLGCGSGIASKGLAAINKTKVVASDLSGSCLDIAQKRLKVLKNFFPVQASIEAIPFKDGSFDFVNCNGVLHHLSDADMALEEIFRVTKPGGMLFIGVYGRGGLMNEFKINIYRFCARLLPYLLLRKLLWTKNKDELLDNICVPVRRAFSEKEIRSKLSHSGFSQTKRVAEGFYRIPSNGWERLMIGPDGMYLHFLAKKEE